MRGSTAIGTVLASLLATSAIGQTTSDADDANPVRYLEPACGSGALAAELATSRGEVVLSWLEPGRTDDEPNECALRFSRLAQGRWTKPRTIAENSDFFANWADCPSVVPGPNNTMLAHWLAKSSDASYSYDVALALSADGGDTWRRIANLHDDDTKTEHGFVSIVADRGGFDAVWLDGRATATGGAMSLRAAHVDSQPTDQAVLDSVVLDPDVCSCCQTSVARTGLGLVAVYRDHAAGEVRDISIVRRTAEGWTTPQPVHADGWNIAGCPVNGPSVDYADGHLAVAWFTAADSRPRVQVAFSTDHGESFAKPLVIDAAAPLGRVDVVAGHGHAVILWLGRTQDAAEVRLRSASPDGSLGNVMSLGSVGASRASGFPRLVRDDENLVVAWRDTTGEPKLRTAIIPIDTLLRANRAR